MHGWLYSLTSTKQTPKEHNTDVFLNKHTISGHSVSMQQTKIASFPGINKNREIVDCLSYPFFLYNLHPHQLSTSFQCSKNTLAKKSNHLHLENFQSCSTSYDLLLFLWLDKFHYKLETKARPAVISQRFSYQQSTSRINCSISVLQRKQPQPGDVAFPRQDN